MSSNMREESFTNARSSLLRDTDSVDTDMHRGSHLGGINLCHYLQGV